MNQSNKQLATTLSFVGGLMSILLVLAILSENIIAIVTVAIFFVIGIVGIIHQNKKQGFSTLQSHESVRSEK